MYESRGDNVKQLGKRWHENDYQNLEDLDDAWDYLGIRSNREKGILSDIAAVRQCSDAVAFCFDIPGSIRVLADHCDPNSARRLVFCQKLINESANVGVQNVAIAAEGQGMRQDDGKKEEWKSREWKGRMHECLWPEGLGRCGRPLIT